MKKVQVLLVAALLVGSSTVSFAQGGGGGRAGGRGNQIAALLQNITLTAEQQAAVDSIVVKYTAQRQALMADQSGEMDARRTKMMELSANQATEVKAVLTAEQKAVFEQNQAAAAARRGGGRPPQL